MSSTLGAPLRISSPDVLCSLARRLPSEQNAEPMKRRALIPYAAPAPRKRHGR